MDEVEVTEDDERLTRAKKTSRRRRPGSASRSRPRSATSSNTAHRSGASATASPRDKNVHREQNRDADAQQRRGSRMRGHSNSSSAPQLCGVSNIDHKSDAGEDDDETTDATRMTSNLADENQGRGQTFGQRKTRRPSTDCDIDAVISEPKQVGAGCQGDDTEAEGSAQLVHQLKSQKQEAESRRRHLELRCEQLEGIAGCEVNRRGLQVTKNRVR